MKLKVEQLLIKRGNRVAKAAIEFTKEDGFLNGFHLVGFTICDDADKGLFVLFPASIVKKANENKPYFFLRPNDETRLAQLETFILDKYEDILNSTTKSERKTNNKTNTLEQIELDEV